MAKKTKTRGPQIDPITLVDLVDNDGTLLRAGDSRDAERFTGAELGGLDLTGITFRECEFRAVSLGDTKLRGATFSECIAADVHAPVFSAPRSSWRDVRIDHSRLGSVELYDATLRSVHFDGCKLDFVNLRNATLTDVLLSNCIIDELDLSTATVQRFELQNCRIGTLDVANAKLADADLRSSDFGAVHGVEGLRGATIDDSQLSLMAPLLAAHLGLIVD
ncbi:pentapeptide repeat-containing protein [Glaciibacter sp. 2TAF33]|uniref:pentapeptide repeat-containing protein n=1 Tax=Glaciibacter sp. 2TAF33 TaxID=3233015 RepID=UPI003F91E55E